MYVYEYSNHGGFEWVLDGEVVMQDDARLDVNFGRCVILEVLQVG